MPETIRTTPTTNENLLKVDPNAEMPETNLPSDTLPGSNTSNQLESTSDILVDNTTPQPPSNSGKGILNWGKKGGQTLDNTKTKTLTQTWFTPINILVAVVALIAAYIFFKR